MGHEARRMRGARPRRRRRGAARCGRSRRGWPGRAQSRTRPAAPRPTCGHSCSAARRPARPRRARVSRARIFAALAAPLLASSRGASRARARGRAPWHATAPEAPATLALSDTGNRETPVLPQRTPASAAQPAPAVRPAATRDRPRGAGAGAAAGRGGRARRRAARACGTAARAMNWKSSSPARPACQATWRRGSWSSMSATGTSATPPRPSAPAAPSAGRSQGGRPWRRACRDAARVGGRAAARTPAWAPRAPARRRGGGPRWVLPRGGGAATPRQRRLNARDHTAERAQRTASALAAQAQRPSGGRGPGCSSLRPQMSGAVSGAVLRCYQQL